MPHWKQKAEVIAPIEVESPYTAKAVADLQRKAGPKLNAHQNVWLQKIQFNIQL